MALEPGQLLILRQGDTPLPCGAALPPLEPVCELQSAWAMFLRQTGEAEFTPYCQATE